MARFPFKIALIALASASILTSCDVALSPSEGGGYIGYYNQFPLMPLPSPRPVVPLYYPQPNPKPNFRPQVNQGRPPMGNNTNIGGQQPGAPSQGGSNGMINRPANPPTPSQGRPPRN